MTGPLRGNRGVGFDRMVLYYADRIAAHQLSGIRGIRELADVMSRRRDYGFEAQPWSYSKMRRVLIRGSELGVLFPVRSLSEAAADRPANYGSRSAKVFSAGPSGKPA